MEKCLFVVPTHGQHFEHAYKLRDTFNRLELKADLLFVLSDNNEYHGFESGRAKKSFIFDGFPRGADHRGIISVKKFQGVEAACNMGYEYAIVIDCETTFTRSFNSYEVAKYLSNQKKVYSTLTNNQTLIDINRSAADFFDTEDRKRLSELTKDFREYFWFNDLAFYDISVCRRFFDKVYAGDPNGFYSRISSAHFDHIIYIYYCLLYEDYTIINLNEKIDLPLEPFANFHLGAVESIGDRNTRDRVPRELAQKIVKEINPFWMPYGTDLTSDNCFMLYHYDRA